MSVLEELEGLSQRVAARLQELEPLVAEYHQLREIAERLDVNVPAARQSATAPSSPAAVKPSPPARKAAASRKPARKRSAAKRTASRPRSSRTDPRSRPGGTRAIGHDRRERILDLIRSRPGISVPQISAELGVDPPPLYRVVRKLSANGVIRKDGKGLELVG